MMLTQFARLIKAVAVLAWVIFLHPAVDAQDPSFSQFFSSPLTLNPALTGNFNGTIRAVSNVRSQNADYNNAYNTKTVSVDFNLMTNKIKSIDLLSMGVLLLSDQTGNKIITHNNLGISLSYMKGLDNEHKRLITIGFQGNYSNRRFNSSNAQFEDQLTPSGFTIPSTDLLLNNNLNLSSLDINTGLLFQYAPTSEHHYYIGAAVFNLLQAQKGFGNSASIAPLRKSIHGGMMSPIGYAGTFHASFHLQEQMGFTQLLIGTAYSYYIKDALQSYVELYAGAWYRTDQSVIPYIGIEWNYFRLGYTNDINFSNRITTGQLRHSNEISLYYTLNKDKSLLKYKCGVF